MSGGPLEGVRVLEIAGMGPGPFAGMMLADMGAEVIRVDRADTVASHDGTPHWDDLARGRRSLAVDLKNPQGLEVVLQLADTCDVLIEGFRPGVTERLGLGPDVLLERNPRLVYGRMTGWGQEGPYAMLAGHDVNYIAIAGALHPMGPGDRPPTPPLNLVGDFGGGGMLLAFGVVAALLEVQRSGRGQVIDAAMVDGAALMMTMMRSLWSVGGWSDDRGTNFLDGGAPFYGAYETSDGHFISVGSIEPHFYGRFRLAFGLSGPEWDDQTDTAGWPARRAELASVIAAKTRAEWTELLEGIDLCFAPVLSIGEAPDHPHNQARATFVEAWGRVQAAPAPRMSRTAPKLDVPPPHAGQHTDELLVELLGLHEEAVQELRASGAIR